MVSIRMTRVAAVVLSVWAAGSFAAGLLALGVLVAPDSRSSLWLPFALLALSATFWLAALGVWRPRRSSVLRVRVAGIASGPLFGLAAWAVTAPAERRAAIFAIAIAWLLLAALAEWLARSISRQAATLAPAV